MRPLTVEGVFKARAFSWQVRRFDSGSVAVTVDFECASMRQPDGEWKEATEPRSVRGDFFVTGKDGKIGKAQERNIETLCSVLGWDGSLLSVSGPPPEHEVQVVVEPDEYKGKVTYKVKWLNSADFGGKASAELSHSEAVDLDAKLAKVAAKYKGAKKPAPAGKATVTPDDVPF